MVPKIFGTKNFLEKFFWICHESVMNLFSMWIFWICFDSVRNIFWTWMFVTHSLGHKHIFGPKKVWSNKIIQKKFQSVLNLSGMVFDHESSVNLGLSIREIWFQKYLGQKKILTKIFWICHESFFNVNVIWMCRQLYHSRLKRFCVKKNLGLKKILVLKKFWVRQNFGCYN